MAATHAGPRLGELLVTMGCLGAEDVSAALHQHRQRGMPLGRVLLEDRLCTENDVVRALESAGPRRKLQIAVAALYGTTNAEVPPSVFLFGWQPAMVVYLKEALLQQGMTGIPAEPNDVLSSQPSDVVVAPLWSLPRLLPVGQRLVSHLIVQAEGSDADLDYARSIGARGFLPAAFDGEWLHRTLRRFIPLGNR